jgi:hypothetical protein
MRLTGQNRRQLECAMKVCEFLFKPSSPFSQGMFHEAFIVDVQQIENVKS